MIANGIGLTSDSFESIYATGGTEIAEIYGGINYANPVFYQTQTLTGTASLVFNSYPDAIRNYTVSGNMTQNSTPTTSNPVYPVECGDLVASGTYAGKYAIPITCGGETKTIYLDEPLRKIGDYQDTVSENGTVQRIITKIILDGSENWVVAADNLNRYFRIEYDSSFLVGSEGICSHFTRTSITSTNESIGFNVVNPTSTGGNTTIPFRRRTSDDLSSFKGWLSYQYNLGTPVTVYAVLKNPETESVTVPQLSATAGQNTITFGTTLQPSSMRITGHIRPAIS